MLLLVPLAALFDSDSAECCLLKLELDIINELVLCGMPLRPLCGIIRKDGDFLTPVLLLSEPELLALLLLLLLVIRV